MKSQGGIMIIVKALNVSDMHEVIKLKVLCWPEELAGLSSAVLDFEKEYVFWTTWMNTAKEHNDTRLLYGAFENGELLGSAFGSYAETEDIPKNGIELNGLWVSPNHRGKGISLLLLTKMLDIFSKLGREQLVIYNFHQSSSNSFYRKFGCKVLRKDTQLEEHLPVDVFIGDITEINAKMKSSLLHYIPSINGERRKI